MTSIAKNQDQGNGKRHHYLYSLTYYQSYHFVIQYDHSCHLFLKSYKCLVISLVNCEYLVDKSLVNSSTV